MTKVLMTLSGGGVMAAQDIPVSGLEIVDRVGVAGIAMWLIYWVTTQVTKGMKDQAQAMKAQAQAMKELAVEVGKLAEKD